MVEELQQGPKAGVKWPAEVDEYRDPNTGVRVRQLTNYPDAQDHHLYFTTDGWYDDGRRMVLRSQREGRRNLFSIDVETGVITQLTDLPDQVYGSTQVNETTREIYFGQSLNGDRYGNDVIAALNIDTLEVNEIARKPDGYEEYEFGVDDVLADDERLLVSVSERTDGEGLEGTRATYPHCAIFIVQIDGENPELIHEEEHWISHVNASPTRPELFTYCHEGPWDNVDNRIHLVNTETDENYQLRAVDENEAVGHEYWLADGETVGYHGWRGERNTENCFHGFVRYDDTDCIETPIPVRRTHCHANTRDLFVCDGDDTHVHSLLLYQWDEETGEYEGPRKLTTHAWSEDSPHPHARFSPDGSMIVYDGDRPGEDNNVFLVDVPDFEKLPLHEST